MGGVSITRNIQVIRAVKGADGLTPMPNLLRNADLNPKSVSNDTARNEGFAWKASNAEGGVIRHEPNVMPPHAGAKVVSCESFKRSTYWRDNVECYAGIVQNVHIISGVTYTFSVYVKGADAGWMIAHPIDNTHFEIRRANPIDEGKNTAEGWKRYAVTFTPRISGDTWIMLRSWSRDKNEAGGKVYFACPKLEESYKPTPWTRAQEDFRGAAMRPLGDWDALPDGFKFQSGGVGEEFIDVVSVKSEGALLWWSCKRSHAKTKDTRPNVNAPFWELGQNLRFVATDLFLAKMAFIENLGVRNVETRNAANQVVFSAEENGNVFIGGNARIGGMRCNVPVVITPGNYSNYYEEETSEGLFFSPFRIGPTIVFSGDFGQRKIYITHHLPEDEGSRKISFGTREFEEQMARRMSYLGTLVHVLNSTRNSTIRIKNLPEIDAEYSDYIELKYIFRFSPIVIHSDGSSSYRTVWEAKVIKNKP